MNGESTHMEISFPMARHQEALQHSFFFFFFGNKLNETKWDQSEGIKI